MSEVPELVRRNCLMLLLRVDGMKSREIAEVIGVSRWTVRVGIAAARELGRRWSGRSWDDEGDQVEGWERSSGIRGGRRHLGRSGGVAGVPIADLAGGRRVG